MAISLGIYPTFSDQPMSPRIWKGSIDVGAHFTVVPCLEHAQKPVASVGIDTGSSWLTGYRVPVPGPHDSSAGSLMNEFIKLPFYADVVMGI